MFSQYKFSPSFISQQAADTAKALATAKPGVNPAQFAAATIADRLRAKPASYLQYGPYWWAVKAALRALGEDFGPNDDAGIRFEYGDGFPAYGALVAAEQFRQHYGQNFFAGTAQFILDDQGEESYVLFDTDMEIRKLGGKFPLRVAADMAAVEVETEGVLDDAGAAPGTGLATAWPLQDATLTPYAVKFEHEAKLWTANVYALDSTSASDKVKLMQSNGRIGRAIEFSKSVGDAALDSTDYTAPLYIDRTACSVSEMAATGILART